MEILKNFLSHQGKGIAGYTLVLSGFLLISSIAAASATGEWMDTGSTIDPNNPPSFISTPGSTASAGQDTVTAVSNYAASPGEDTEYAIASATVVDSAQWVDGDGYTPTAPYGFSWVYKQDVSGVTGPASATAATSGATAGNIVQLQAPYPSGYNITKSMVAPAPNSNGASDLSDFNINGSIQAATAAGPDQSGDPENKPGSTQATAQSTLDIMIISDEGPPA